jgi:xylulokinase
MNINEHLILTIDLGTSGPKVSVYNAHTDLIDSSFETNLVILKEHGGAEQDTTEWTQSITKSISNYKGTRTFQS